MIKSQIFPMVRAGGDQWRSLGNNDEASPSYEVGDRLAHMWPDMTWSEPMWLCVKAGDLSEARFMKLGEAT
jgi:hypothetical protein